MRHRWDHPVKNGRWYALGPGVVAKVGWGDLTLGNLRDALPALGDGWAFVVLPENPPGGVHLHPATSKAASGLWCWYDKPDHPKPRVSALAAEAQFSALDGQVASVDRTGLANRNGSVYLSLGYRYTEQGRFIQAAKVRFPAFTPAALTDRLLAVVGGDIVSVDVVDAYFDEL